MYLVSPEVAQQLTGYRVHRGALASMQRRPLPRVDEVVGGARRIVVLEDIVDHTNVGAIFRCVAALGFDAVVLAPRCADPLYRRSVRVSMGAVFAVPYARMDDWREGLGALRAAGFLLLALTPAPDAVPIGELLGGAGRRGGRVPPDTRLGLLLGRRGGRPVQPLARSGRPERADTDEPGSGLAQRRVGGRDRLLRPGAAPLKRHAEDVVAVAGL